MLCTKTDKNIVKFSDKNTREKITQARKQVVWPLSKTCHICCQKYPCISIFLPDNLQDCWKALKIWGVVNHFTFVVCVAAFDNLRFAREEKLSVLHLALS